MPWWAVAYLILLTAVILISIIKDYLDRRGIGYIFGEISSGAIGFMFIVGYWKPELVSFISWFIVPLLIYAVIWDQYALKFMRQSNYPDLTEQENRDMDRYSKIFAVLFILPCYIAGLLLAFKILS